MMCRVFAMYMRDDDAFDAAGSNTDLLESAIARSKPVSPMTVRDSLTAARM